MSTKEKTAAACCEPDTNEYIDTQDPHEIKNIVKERYSKIATQSKKENESSCCGTGSCDTIDYSVFALDYTKLKGYNPDADLGLGCGLPTEFAQIKEGDTVVDLGSGAGNDVFIARAIAGEKGRVIGVDFTKAMIDKANKNKAKLGFDNVEFRYGDIDKMPIDDNTADVIVSNCVLNLVPDKAKAFAEIYRVLKPGGHISVSDIVTSGELPLKIRAAANMYAGCIGGALVNEDYLDKIKQAGLVNVTVQKDRVINVPDEIMLDYLTIDELTAYKETGMNISSITVYAEKPKK